VAGDEAMCVVLTKSYGRKGVSLALLRSHFRQQIAEHEGQEARVAAAELEAEQNQKRFHAAFTHASIGMAIVSPQGTCCKPTRRCAHCSDTTRHSCAALVPQSAACRRRTLLERHVAGVVDRRTDSFSIENALCERGSARGLGVAALCAVRSRYECRDGPHLPAADITSRRRAEANCTNIATTQPHRPRNRSCFQERLSSAVERSRTDRRFSFAVMYLDLDRFKVVNDTLGHPAGRTTAEEVARRLSECVRPKDLVARLGGDEFAILMRCLCLCGRQCLCGNGQRWSLIPNPALIAPTATQRTASSL